MDDPSIRVQVSPSQSAYFAGETFSVAITFTNTRLPSTPHPASAPVHKSHKRNAHSISSAPLARPPTSPGLGTRPPDFIKALGSGVNGEEGRKGLIGNGTVEYVNGKGKGKEVLEVRRAALEKAKEKARSASIDIPSSEEYVQAYEVDSSPVTPRSAFPLPQNHPHARKHSVFDGHLQLNEVQPQPSPSIPSTSSTSTFTLALDPIAETPQSPVPPTPLPHTPSPSNTIVSELHSYPPHPYPPRKQAHHTLGHGHPPLPIPPTPATTKPLPPNTTLLLYSYAQLSGTAHILPPNTPEALTTLRAQLLKKPVLGGGSMDISRTRTNPRTHSRSTSLTGSLLSLLSPSSYSPSIGRSRPPSLSSQSDASSGGVGLGLSVGAGNGNGNGNAVGGGEEGEEEMPLPVFEVQPAMLAVDLALSPGESRSYTYTLPLPSTLPPTFRGRMIRFSYELVVGTCRRGDSGEGNASSIGVTVSRVMKVPIRVYNWVSVGKPQRPYDLLLPVRKPDSGKVLDLGSAGGDGTDGKKDLASSKLSPTTTPCGSLDDLRAYGERLLSTFPAEGSTGVRIKEPAESVPENVPSSSTGPASASGSQGGEDPLRAFERERERERERQGEEGELTGCREAVEILTRNPKKVSYDVTKDGIKVAVLTFTKSAYRLGETVLGVVEINERGGRGKVISLSATLETNESLPASLGTPNPTTNTSSTRRVHAEHHASFTGSTLRTTFALDIPSDACPGFGIVLSAPSLLGNVNVNGSGSGKAGGLAWKVHLTLLVGVTAPNARVRGLTRDGEPTAWGSAWRAPVGIAPEQQEVHVASAGKEVKQPSQPTQSWTSYLMSSFLGTGEREYHDGDDIDDEVPSSPAAKEEEEEEEGDWRDVQVEIVECEVPVVVWPGNTAFSAVDVVFEV
ncbi:Rgp1-domain-containing protein [Suillus clintonianus]|uniref:Rgp1-domain-containing protein n=1 Tax=Suillus clintonianus TaxID=1904413 RepID=UPI001B872162|nr:Rgp1-domain-containing protein [Suillus clintonianus]KAG2135101.1 Rgp1-domain-containing protein [Suillus clintonianus]